MVVLDKKAEKSLDVEEVLEQGNMLMCQITKDIKQLKTKYDDAALMVVVDTPHGKRNFWPSALVTNKLIDRFGHDTDRWINQFVALSVVDYTGRNNQPYQRIDVNQQWLDGKLFDDMPGTPVEEEPQPQPPKDVNNNMPTSAEIAKYQKAKAEAEAAAKAETGA